MTKVFKLAEAGIEVTLGKYATQADGSAWVRMGDNVVLSTVVASSDAKDFIGFFPLTVEYREKTSAAGKIPGGYIKREGRLSDTEVLTSRVIDRTIRPFFPKYYFNEVQAISAVYSSDGQVPTAVMSIIGTSLALGISSVPFQEPLGAVVVHRIDGQWVFNRGLESGKESSVHVLVAGTKDGISMVEGNTNGLGEDEVVDLLFAAHEEIKKQVAWQEEIIAQIGKEKVMPEQSFDWQGWETKVSQVCKELDVTRALFQENKKVRKEAIRAVKDQVRAAFADALEAGDLDDSKLSFLFDVALKTSLPDRIVERSARFDGRDFTTVRPIEVEVGLLPQVHGSATFKRGETMALANVTLGTAQDAQKVDMLVEGMIERSFMLHYNFPPFAVGEARPIRGVSRREIGHGYLAQNSFINALPSQEDFPYTIRSLVDVLDCNGSSSMATVCSTTMALMDAGVPIKEMVAGVAMGLIQSSDGAFHVLTDILGSEDGLGLMDLKVTGSENGINAIQMDIKLKGGLSRDLMARALRQSSEARRHILSKMAAVLDKPRSEVSLLAPKVSSFNIDTDKIGVVIGPSGKTIKEIIAQTETQIDIENDGRVNIYAKDHASAVRAEQWVKVLAGEIKEGAVFNGVIRRFVDFGIFVELVPGKDGLLHISAISKKKQAALQQVYSVNDPLQVKVVSYEKESGRVKLVAPALAD